MKNAIEILLNPGTPSFNIDLKKTATPSQPGLIRFHQFLMKDCTVDIRFGTSTGKYFSKTFSHPSTDSNPLYIFNNNENYHILQFEIKEITGVSPSCAINFDLQPAPEIISEHVLVIG